MKLPNLSRFLILCLILLGTGCIFRAQPASEPTSTAPATAVFPTFPPGQKPTAPGIPTPGAATVQAATLAVGQTALAHQQITLDGAWEMVHTQSLDDPIPGQGWAAFQVPGILDGYNYERAWFQRTFFARQDWSGRRLLLHFNGVKYNSRILLNGQLVGEHFNGYDAFDVDITAAVKWGADNLLQVGVHDWTGVFSASDVTLTPYGRDWDVLRGVPKDRLLSPIGGLFTFYGIWDSVFLQVVPQVHITACTILSNVAADRLDVDVTIRNESDAIFYAPLEGRVFAWNGAGQAANGQWETGADPVSLLPTENVTIAAGRSRVVRLSLQKPGLAEWSPTQPNLYVLELAFNQPGGDVLRERFGWREFTTSAGDFYLNGKKVHLLAASWWPDGQRWTREQVSAELRATRAANVIAFRTHTQPWPEIWYEVADEVGLMMIPEGAVWNDDTSYRIDDEAFWRNYAAHLEAMVNHLRNHPSIVMWSLENELSGERINDQTPVAETRLAQVGLRIRQIDPTRPITFESDGDPGGVSNVIGLHYPNEYPQYRLWPAAAYWLNQPRFITSGGGFFWDEQPFFWDHRKPLYIGEYMWEPSADPSTHTVLMGDRAYAGYAYYARQAKVMAWRMQIQAYRFFGVSGHSPWTMKEEGSLDQTNPFWVATRDMYRPLAVFQHDANAHFFSGDSVPRRVDLYNDTIHDLPAVNFAWALYDGKQRISGAEQVLGMASGDHVELEIKLTLPQVSQRKRLTLRLVLAASGEQRFVQDYRLDVFPRSLNLNKIKLTLLDPQNTLEETLADAGAAVHAITSLREWDGQGILVIGPGALHSVTPDNIPEIGASDADRAWLREQVAAGGRVLTLEQAQDASIGYLPVRLSDQPSTITFIQTPNHPILANLSDEDLRWWGSDELVSINEPFRASQAGTQALVVSGSSLGISHAPLTEIQQGSGAWLVCQLRVASKLRTEPVAQVLLDGMLHYLNAYTAPLGKVYYYPADTDLSRLRLSAEPLTDWKSLAYPSARLLLLFGSAAQIPEAGLRSFLLAGGTVLWDRPDAQLNPLLHNIGARVQVEPWKGTALRSEGSYSLLDTLTREDLYWIGAAGKHTEDAAELAPHASAFFMPDAEVVASGETIPASKDVTLNGDLVSIQGGEVALSSNGSATWAVTLPQDGRYQFTLLAHGTPVSGVYPLSQVQMDGLSIGIIVAGSEVRSGYRLFFDARKGKHTFTVAYTNDTYAPPEDRNLYLSSYQVSPAAELNDLENLTSPAALVRSKVGAGSLILSAIEWDSAGQNTLRGQRYFAGLLNGLGAQFAGGTAPQVVEAESMRLSSPAQTVFVDGQYVAMFVNAYVEDEIHIVRGGSYRVSILGKGTPVNGRYPLVQVSLDGQGFGTVELNSAADGLHAFLADLPEGTYTLRIAFVNDEWSPNTGEDRNAWIDRIEFELQE
jgi:hypothetical protein